MIITVDGPAGSGKSTVARILARRLSLPYLNSGAIYRTVTLGVLEAGISFDDREGVARVIRDLPFRSVEHPDGTRFFLGDRDVTHRIKDPDVTREVYRIANDGEYRRLLVGLQRTAAAGGGVVAEGRDMGTVIFPDADVKFFLDAPAEERARRQHEELLARGVASDYEVLLEDLRRRDLHDTGRSDAPLRAAPGALHVDSGGLSIEQVVERMSGIISASLEAAGSRPDSEVSSRRGETAGDGVAGS